MVSQSFYSVIGLLTKLLFNSEGVYFKQEFFMKNGYLNKKFLNFVKSYECNIDIDLPVDITEFDFNKKIWEHTHKIFNLTYTLYDNTTNHICIPNNDDDDNYYYSDISSDSNSEDS